ncbi:putative protein RALF-like 1 [Cocos nucifera]|uniref:Uncharacterized protein n=1 Tax=Cocos nucifera TaxID=13894 RepID=A0A8K0N3R9_COCNU|nr:putative protein RALF-like 1 [Cocos nucifera]
MIAIHHAFGVLSLSYFPSFRAIRVGRGVLELDERGTGRGKQAMGFALRNSFLVVALVLFLAVSAAVPPGAVVAATNAYNGSFSMQWHAVEGEEWALDSETNRRILQSTKKYIDYHAIKDKNTPAAPAKSGQPYNRNCKKIFQCKGGH